MHRLASPSYINFTHARMEVTMPGGGTMEGCTSTTCNNSCFVSLSWHSLRRP